MIKKVEYLCMFLLGGALYGLIEMLWRGYTHPSMIVAGGVCLLSIHLLNHAAPYMRLSIKYFLGSVIITAVEFSFGVVVNLILRLNVWDYSALPLNLLGQVCPQFMLVWFLLSVPAVFISSWTRVFFDGLKRREEQTA